MVMKFFTLIIVLGVKVLTPWWKHISRTNGLYHVCYELTIVHLGRGKVQAGEDYMFQRQLRDVKLALSKNLLGSVTRIPILSEIWYDRVFLYSQHSGGQSRPQHKTKHQ